MSDNSRISAPTPVSATGRGFSATPLVKSAPVAGISADLGDRHPPFHSHGKVIAQNRETKETTIATPNGNIVVKTDIVLPIGADVGVDIYLQKAQLVANITLMRREAEMANAVKDAVTDADTPEVKPPVIPPPALQAGDKVAAIRLDANIPSAPAVNISEAMITTAAQSIDALRQKPAAEIVRFISETAGLSQETIRLLQSSANTSETIRQLSPQQQKLVIDAVARLTPREVLSPQANVIDDAMVPLLKVSPLETPIAPATTTPVVPLQQMQAMMGMFLGTPLPDNMLAAVMPEAAKLQQSIAHNILPEEKFFELAIRAISPAGTAPPVGGAITGTVESLTSSGAPVIRLDDNNTEHPTLYVVKTPVSIDVGTQISFDIVPLTPQQIVENFTTPAPAKWEALDEVIQSLSAMPAATAALIRQTIPAATPKFTPAALFFLAALRIGVAENWIGAPALQALRDMGRRDLAEKVSGDFSKLSAQSRETLAGDWRSITMPFLHDDTLNQLQFYIRRHHGDDSEEAGKGDKEAVTRFILNLHLSRMGDLQLDGLLRAKKLDIILRSEDPLPESMRRDLMQAFARGLEQSGSQGGISFQIKREKWVTIGEEKHAETIA